MAKNTHHTLLTFFDNGLRLIIILVYKNKETTENLTFKNFLELVNEKQYKTNIEEYTM